MKELFEEVKEIVKTDPNPGDHLNKLFEEAGELAQLVNYITGRKRGYEYDKDELHQDLIDEAADTIQCVFAIMAAVGVDYEEVAKRMTKKNQVYKTYNTN